MVTVARSDLHRIMYTTPYSFSGVSRPLLLVVFCRITIRLLSNHIFRKSGDRLPSPIWSIVLQKFFTRFTLHVSESINIFFVFFFHLVASLDLLHHRTLLHTYPPNILWWSGVHKIANVTTLYSRRPDNPVLEGVLRFRVAKAFFTLCTRR